MPAKLDLNIKQGDTYTLTINFKDGNGDNRDVTGLLYDAEIRRAGVSQLSPARELLAEFEVDDSNASVGQIVFTLQHEESSAIPPGRHWYDIQEIDESTSPDTVFTPIEGSVTVVPDVTLAVPAS